MSKFKDLYTFKEEGIADNLLYIDQLYSFIKERVTEDDKYKINRPNFVREFKGHKEGIKSLSHGNAITISSAVRCIFNHFDDYQICQEIGLQISSTAFNSQSTEQTKTLFSLYKAISEFDTKQITFKLNERLEIDDTNFCIPSIENTYRTDFSDFEWKKICIFENYYSKYVASSEDHYETALKQKWETFEYLKKITSMSRNFEKLNKSTIKARTIRQKVYEHSQNILIWTRKKHFPAVIESQLMKKFDIINPDITFPPVCVDTPQSIDTNSVMLIFSCIESEKYEEYSKIATNFLQIKHHLNASQIIFVSPETIENYRRPNNGIARFHLRDDLLQGKLENDIIQVIQPARQSFNGNESNECDACFNHCDLVKPLSLHNFELLQEWFLDIPLDIQIILDKFINRDSFYSSGNKKTFLLSKMERLYGAYDILLNTFNKNYIGILQQANTDELAMHFQSITTVFSIASNTGISTSLVTAEKKIKEKATDDLCYYNTYLKKFPFHYQTTTGIADQLVNLRDCHLILMMDNLVRMTFRSDPNPGENRSGQLCTLPLTLQGLPKDSSVTDSWHTADCLKDQNCQCKKDINLQKEDFDNALVSLTNEETVCWERFQKLLTWGSVPLWKKLRTTNLVSLQQSIDHNWTEEDSLSDLSDLLLNVDEFEQEYTNDDLSEIEEVHQFATEEYEDNLDSLVQTANLLYQTSELLSNDINMSGIFELDLQQNDLEDSFSHLHIESDETETSIPTLDSTSCISSPSHSQASTVLKTFGFEKYNVPPLLCRHPPPATGRDDDILKLREILDDVLIKTGRINMSYEGQDRILFGPDNKIGANLLQLLSQDNKYRHFLPEFPLLHLRKSKINTLFSAYKDAGLLQLLMYMCDDEKKEWTKLISMEHIDVATRFVRRLSLSFHVAFLCRFLQCIDDKDAESVLDMLESGQISSETWHKQLSEFMDAGSSKNSTFRMHMEMMQHCDEVVAVYLAERLGGFDGYNLLLGAVKSSLLFSFLNGASSYGPFCVRLLLEHFSAGHFHQCMKKTLYSTPIGNTSTNFASDSKREMDHQDVIRGFRSGSSLPAVTSRMSLIDTLNETHQRRTIDRGKSSDNGPNENNQSDVEWKLTEVDLNHIIPTASLILRRGGLNLEENTMPENVYNTKKLFLPPAILDEITFDVGKYLVKRFLVNNQLLGMKTDDMPDIRNFKGPPTLLSKAKRSKGITLKRTSEKTTTITKSERELKEEKRSQTLKKENQMADLLSSEMNMCQSLVKPDCSKPKVMKSKGIQEALISMLADLKSEKKDLITLGTNTIPNTISTSIQMATVEFAGVKFKAKVSTGIQYIRYVQNAVLKNIVQSLPNLERLVLCEEKYSFTPDHFKAATHQQRKAKEKLTISHLRDPDAAINAATFRKDDIITTREGKSLISKFLAANAVDLRIAANVILDIDSELNLQRIQCHHGEHCTCEYYTTPIRCIFKKSQQQPTVQDLITVSQRKGEAEMAQVDWLLGEQSKLSPSMSACSILTSGDIDAIPIHLYSLSKKWPQVNGRYSHTVSVILQKPHKKMDIYNLTDMMEILESSFKNEDDIVKKVSIVLCMGGNDFIPKFHNISHKKMLSLFMSNEHFRLNLFEKSDKNIHQLNTTVYKDFVKTLFSSMSNIQDSFEEVRHNSMFCKQRKTKNQMDTNLLRNAKLWLPPESCLDRMAELVNLQIEYLETTGDSMAKLPNFLEKDCLKMTETGEVEYHFGPLARENIEHLLGNHKRQMKETPQKGKRKKKMLTSTPSKANT